MDLLAELKDRLRILHPEEDSRLDTIIEKSKAYFEELTAASFDYVNEPRVADLLLERCRYDYNNAADEFEENYQKELSRLIMNVALGRVGTVNEEAISGDV